MTRSKLRTATVALAAVAATLATTGSAQAYDKGNCDSAFGASNLKGANKFIIETGTEGMVDFGDDFHVFGEPRGTAIVCADKGTRVRVLGKLFDDAGSNPNAQVFVGDARPKVRIAFLRGSAVDTSKTLLYTGNGTRVEKTVDGGSGGAYSAVRFTLLRGSTPVANGQTTIGTGIID